jgi:putative transposase
MRKTKFTEEQMIDAVKQLEAGRPVKGLARELGITDQTLYNWRAKYSGLDVNEARRLRARSSSQRAAHGAESGMGPGLRQRCRG